MDTYNIKIDKNNEDIKIEVNNEVIIPEQKINNVEIFTLSQIKRSIIILDKQIKELNKRKERFENIIKNTKEKVDKVIQEKDMKISRIK